MSRDETPIAVLTSGMGLGTYIPALILRDKLRQMKLEPHIFVYESLFTEKAQKNYESYKKLWPIVK